MRKWNAALSISIIILFLIHAVIGGFQLSGIFSGGNSIMTVLAWLMVCLIVLHTLFGCILTAQTLSAQKKAGAVYWKENRLFWLRRISGFAVMLLILTHLVIFFGKSGTGFRLHLFGGAELLTQILLVAAIAVHILTNIRPLMLGFGIRKFHTFMLDILLIISVLLVFAAAAFLIYYIRWQQI